MKMENVIEQKLAKFSKALGIVSNTCKPNLVQKSSTIKVHSALTLHILLYRHEILIFRQKDKNGLTTIEKKFLRITAGYPILGARVSVAFKALRYMSEGSGIDSQSRPGFFPWHLTVESASKDEIRIMVVKAAGA